MSDPYGFPQAGTPSHWPPPTAEPPASSGWMSPPPPPRRIRAGVVLAIVGAAVAGVALLVAILIGGRGIGEDLAALDALRPAPTTTLPPSPHAVLGTDEGLDAYAARCHDGDMQACDDLFELSEPMSDYEHYGMTCGGRVKPYDVTYCTDLD